MITEGIRFVTDASGRRTDVMVDLDRYGDLWEDIYDILVVRQRQVDPRESLEKVRKQLATATLPPEQAPNGVESFTP